MSPIDCIEEGIREGNWETVCKGFEQLTGKAISLATNMTYKILESAADEYSDALHQIANIASDVLVLKKTQKKESGSLKKKKKKPGRPKKKKTTLPNEEDSSLQLDESKRTSIQKETGGTQLITNEPDPEEVERNKIKAKRANRSKLKLDRPPATLFDVKCNECEGSFKSSRPQGELGQKCPKCLSGKKGRLT